MSISVEYARRMVQSFETATQRNIVAQAKAKQVLKDVNELQENFPELRPDLDERGTFAAYRMLSAGCSLVEQQQFAEGYAQLHAGGDLLESIYRVSDTKETESGFHCLIGALAFYACGHYSRGFILIKGVEPKTPIAGALASFLRRDTSKLVERISDILVKRSESFGTVDPYETALAVTTARALAWVLEYSITGTPEYLENANTALQDAMIISDGRSDPSYWWLARLLKLILDDYGKRSLWKLLPPFFGPSGQGELEKYIHLLALSRPPVVDLWKSQVECLTLALDNSNRGGVVNLRTSAGKTRVAELAILRTLAADQNAKVLYLAPFRSLAFELERSFAKFIGALGYSVTHLYGGSRFSGLDRAMITDARLIIATPEKAKALLRAAPELLGEVKLVVVDEGHLLGADDRNVRNELFLEHLRVVCHANGARMLLLSAVLPNAEELSTWIGGGPQALARSDWKPSDERFGMLKWNRNGVAIEWKGTERCFNPHFVEFRTVSDAKTGKPRQFPKTKNEAVAATAVRLAELGPVLIFAGQAQWVPSMASSVLIALGDDPEPHDWPELEWKLFAAVCEEELGPNSLEQEAARLGIVCHTNNLPPQVRIALERLMAAKAPKVIVATMTLGQGVNIGISTVIVSQTLIGEQRWISKRDFWNICGRAGRAFVDSEGKVLYALDMTRTPVERRKDLRRAEAYLDRRHLGRVESGLLVVCERIIRIADEADIPFPLLLELIANNAYTAPDDDIAQVAHDFDLIDDQLLALHLTLKGDADTSITADWIEGAFRSSLAAIQEQLRDKGDQMEKVIPFLEARAKSILRQVPTASARRAMVASSLPFSIAKAAYADLGYFRELVDEYIARQQTDSALLELVSRLEAWSRANATTIFKGFPSQELLDQVRPLWLKGTPMVEIIAITHEGAQTVCTDFYGYAFTWICHAVAQKFDKEQEAERVTALSNVGLLIEVGLPNEAAAKVFLAGVRSRSVATELAQYVSDPAASVGRIRSALLRKDFRESLSGFASKEALEWLAMLSTEDAKEEEATPYVQPFAIEMPDSVSTLHMRKVESKYYLCSTDYRTQVEVASTETHPFALVANDVRCAFEREGTAWQIVYRDPRLVEPFNFDPDLDFDWEF